jgi:hypothetical protein
MAVVHLDPWNDIVGVGWRTGTVTHVAFEMRMFDGQIEDEYYEYPLTIGGVEGTAGTSASSHAQRLFLQTLTYKQLLVRDTPSGTVKTWSEASASALQFTGLDGFRALRHSQSWAECQVHGHCAGTMPSGFGTQRMFGLDAQQTGDTTIKVPGRADNFSSATSTAMVFWSFVMTSCVPGQVDPNTVINLSSIERVEVAANALAGLGITYNTRPCTIVGLWTPSLLLTPNSGVTAVEVPKRVWVLAEIST